MNFASYSIFYCFKTTHPRAKLSFEIKMRMDCMKLNVQEKGNLIHIKGLARRLVFTRLQPDFLEGYNNNKRYL